MAQAAKAFDPNELSKQETIELAEELLACAVVAGHPLAEKNRGRDAPQADYLKRWAESGYFASRYLLKLKFPKDFAELHDNLAQGAKELVELRIGTEHADRGQFLGCIEV